MAWEGSDSWVLLDGQKVYDARQRRHMRQSDVNEAMGGLGIISGFSQARLSRIETGSDGGSARWVTPLEATVLAAVLMKPVWAILAKDPAEDPRIAEARTLVDELASQSAALTAKLATALAPRTAGQVTEARQQDVTLRLLTDT